MSIDWFGVFVGGSSEPAAIFLTREQAERWARTEYAGVVGREMALVEPVPSPIKAPDFVVGGGGLTWDGYQDWTISTARYYGAGKGDPASIIYCALGLAGESGEAVEKVKKAMRGDSGPGGLDGVGALRRSPAFLGELGDVLYYLARLSAESGFRFSEVVAGNIRKLEDRKARNAVLGSGDAR